MRPRQHLWKLKTEFFSDNECKTLLSSLNFLYQDAKTGKFLYPEYIKLVDLQEEKWTEEIAKTYPDYRFLIIRRKLWSGEGDEEDYVFVPIKNEKLIRLLQYIEEASEREVLKQVLKGNW